MRRFATRSAEAELMDDPAIGYDEFARCLTELEAINRATLAYRPTLDWLKRRIPPGHAASLLDVGSGGGDMLRRIARWADASGRRLALTGVDLNPFARQAAESGRYHPAIAYETSDIFAFDPSRRADYIASSLFTHHLGDQALVDFLRWMERHAGKGWLINDLHRHWLPYHFIRLALRLIPCGRMVRHDAPVSVARSFTRKDWGRLLERAGLPADRCRIRWWFPFRYSVERWK